MNISLLNIKNNVKANQLDSICISITSQTWRQRSKADCVQQRSSVCSVQRVQLVKLPTVQEHFLHQRISGQKKLFATDRELRQNGNFNAQTRQRVNTPQTEGRILDVISANAETSTGKDVPQNTVQWLLYKDFLHPYHLKRQQGLQLASCREEFCEVFLRTCADYPLFPSLILFTLQDRILKSWNAQFPSLACISIWKSTWKVALRAPAAVLCNVVGHRLLALSVLPTRLTVYHELNPYPTAFPYGNGMVLHFYQ